jgi:uncharacterized protein YbjQ (UPF0145 family)
MMITVIITVVLGPGLLIFSWLYGNHYQKKLMQNLLVREKEFLQTAGKDNAHTISFPIPTREITSCGLVIANISVGPSWWQMFIGNIHKIFGGNITMYDRVLAYGRQEVIQRLRENAKEQGWEEIVNVRMETAAIMQTTGGKDSNKRGVLEFVAYGTGIR